METPQEEAKQLVVEFEKILGGISFDNHIYNEVIKCAYLCIERIVIGLHDQGIREPQYWYDVQE